MITRESWSAGLPTLPRPPRHGRRQRHARTRSPTVAATSPPTRRSPTAPSCARRAPTCSTSVASRPVPAPPARWSPRSWTAWCRSSAALAADGVAVSVDTMRHEVASARARGGGGPRQRRLRWPGRRADPRRRGRARCGVRRDALARPLRGDAQARDLRRRARRRPHRAAPSVSSRRRRRGDRARTGSWSTPVSGSPRPPTTTGSCSSDCRSWSRSGCPSSSGPAASRSSGTLLAERGRHSAPGARPGGRQRGAHHDRGDPGRLGRPRPRGAGQPGRHPRGQPLAG